MSNLYVDIIKLHIAYQQIYIVRQHKKVAPGMLEVAIFWTTIDNYLDFLF